MINGLLYVTTIEAEAVRVEYTEINLYKLLEELRANYDLRGLTVYVRHVPEADMFELKVRIPGLVPAIRLPYGNSAQSAFIYEVSFYQLPSLLFSDLA
jgi:hypothetical protein